MKGIDKVDVFSQAARVKKNAKGLRCEGKRFKAAKGLSFHTGDVGIWNSCHRMWERQIELQCLKVIRQVQG